jgi:hypothetical protein
MGQIQARTQHAYPLWAMVLLTRLQSGTRFRDAIKQEGSRVSEAIVARFRRELPGFSDDLDAALVQQYVADVDLCRDNARAMSAQTIVDAYEASRDDDVDQRSRVANRRLVLDVSGAVERDPPASHAIQGLALLGALRDLVSQDVAPVARITEVPSGTTATTSELEATSDSYDGGD